VTDQLPTNVIRHNNFSRENRKNQYEGKSAEGSGKGVKKRENSADKLIKNLYLITEEERLEISVYFLSDFSIEKRLSNISAMFYSLLLVSSSSAGASYLKNSTNLQNSTKYRLHKIKASPPTPDNFHDEKWF
jgi:hypothetical protein